MPERKRFFSIDVFPYHDNIRAKIAIKVTPPFGHMCCCTKLMDLFNSGEKEEIENSILAHFCKDFILPVFNLILLFQHLALSLDVVFPFHCLPNSTQIWRYCPNLPFLFFSCPLLPTFAGIDRKPRTTGLAQSAADLSVY